MVDRADTSAIDIALAVPIRAGRILVCRRAVNVHRGGTWEFPGGKVEPGEQPESAARRELAEETGLDAERLDPLTVLVRDYPDRSLRLHVFVAVDVRGDVQVDGGREWAWMRRDSIEALEMPEANVQILRALRWRLP